jgi:hypothetical protein
MRPLLRHDIVSAIGISITISENVAFFSLAHTLLLKLQGLMGRRISVSNDGRLKQSR